MTDTGTNPPPPGGPTPTPPPGNPPAGPPPAAPPAGQPPAPPAGQGTNPPSGDAAGAGDDANTDWKAMARQWETRAKANNEAAEELAQLKKAQMTELEQAQAAATTASSELETTRAELWRNQVALEAGLSATQAKRLVGATLEELQADAAQLRTDLGLEAKPAGTPPGRPQATNLEGVPVPTNGAELTDMNEWMRNQNSR